MTEGDKTFTQADIEKERAHAQHFKSQLDEISGKFKDLDPDKARAAMEKLAELEKQSAGGDPKKIDELINQAREDERNKIGAKLTEYEKQIGTTGAELTRLKVVQPAMLEAAQIFNSNELELIQMLVERDCMYENGEIVAKGPDGKPMPSSDPRNGTKKLKEYLGDLAGKYPNTVKATVSPGGRAVGDKVSSTTGEMTVDRFMKLSEAERATLPADTRQKLSAQYFKTKS
jgi:hypothetical protein